jgi:hypothetical protein
MNKRAIIRQAIIDRLTPVLPVDCDIFNQRYAPLKNLPAVIIYSDGDNAEYSPAENFIKRKESIKIIVYVEGREDQEIIDSGQVSVIDKLQNIIDIIESEFLKYRENLTGTTYLFRYQSTQIQVNTGLELVEATGIMNFEATYNEVIS